MQTRRTALKHHGKDLQELSIIKVTPTVVHGSSRQQDGDRSTVEEVVPKLIKYYKEGNK